MKDKGYLKLYRSFVDHPLYERDPTAAFLFLTILMLVDYQTGICTSTRFKLAKRIGVKPMTCYKALKRLEREHMVNTSVTPSHTKITVVNWSSFQHSVTPGETAGNTIKRNKNKEVFTKVNTSQVSSNTLIDSVYRYYLECFETTEGRYKLTPERRKKLQTRLNDAGEEMLKQAILGTSQSAFHRGENDRGWKADLDFILRSYEQVERLAGLADTSSKLSVAEAIARL